MQFWKIHAGWALATVLVAAARGRWNSLPPAEPDVHPRGTIADPLLPQLPSPGPAPETAVSPPESPKTTPPTPASDALPEYAFEHLSVEEIRRLLKSDVHKDWWRAARAIDKLVDKELKKELYLLLVDVKDEHLRYSAVATLAFLMGKESLPLLQKALTADPSSWVRRNAALQLGQFGGDGTIEALLKAAHDDDLYTRVNVAAALSKLGQPGAVTDLLPLLTKDLASPDDAVRREAVENLGALKSAQVIPFLIRSLKDLNGSVQRQATAGLSRLEVPEVIPAMEALQKDPSMAATAKEILETFQAWNDRKK